MDLKLPVDDLKGASRAIAGNGCNGKPALQARRSLNTKLALVFQGWPTEAARGVAVVSRPV